MTLESTSLTVEDVQQVRDRSLVEAYEPHDLAQGRLEARLETYGYDVIQHGTDDRHSDEVYFGEGPDLLIEYDGETVAYIEVKTKESAGWFGRCNRRHFNEYVSFTSEVDVPVFIWFAYVDTDEVDPTLHREAFIEVESTAQVEGDVWDVSTETLVFDGMDTETVDSGEYVALDGDDVVQVDRSDIIVDGIPSVHGNDVVELNDKQFRSWEHVHERLSSEDTDIVVSESVESKSDESSIVEERLMEARALVSERTVQNPANESITQLRNSRGQMGPQIRDDSDIEVWVTPCGEVDVFVDGQYVSVGCLCDD